MDGSSNGLGKLLPKTIAAKRRRNKASSIYSSTSNDDVAPQRGPDNPNPDGPASETSSLRRTDSQLSEENADLISFEADTLSPDTRPTAISVHPSQIGHLTTSSPLVQEKYKPESQTSDVLSSEISKLSTRSSTLPQDSSDSLESSAPSLRKSRTQNFLHPDSDPPKRSASGSRLRDVFRSKRGSEKCSSDEKTASEQPSPSPAPNPESEPKASPGRNRALSRGPKLEPLKAPPRTPQTPPRGEPAPPVIVNTPPTPTDPALPIIVATSSSPRRSTNASPVGNMITQRRRAGSNAGPSKLSTITPAPLTPTPEPGPVSPNPAATFFSSMFSAVQNTANSLSNTISTANLTPGNKSRAGTPAQETDKEQQQQQQDGVEVESASMPDLSSESKEPAVKTLGMGDLSLSQLGIAETPSNVPSPVVSKFADSDSRNRSESAPDPPPAVTEIMDDSHLPRPRSLYSANGDHTPPAGSVYEGKSGVHRSGSIRSALGHRRKRGSSIATHNTSASAMGPAISAANSSLAHPHAAGSTAKLTGFAVATKKRNRDFHTLFKSVPDDDYLIEDYSCALQREILAHGRLYISEGHLCFSSNILGWVTTLVMSFDEIVSVEKRSTALVFKNGLEISTLHAKHIFASFASRDTTYDLIIKIWKLGHPHLQSSLNGVRLEEPGGDRTEKVDVENVSVVGSQSISGSDDESADGDDDDDVYDEDEEEEDDQETGVPADATSEAPDKAATRKVSGAAPAPLEKVDESAPASGGDFPGPATHAPTDCGDGATHYEKILGDETIPAPLGKVYTLLFGPGSAAWMGKFLTVDQKCLDLQMEDKRGLTEEVKSRTFTYIKPLNASIGPKQTKCIVTEQLESIDLEKSVNILCSTQNPDVPSGNVFMVKTKYCLTWGENNSTRVQINCTIEWSGKSWLKVPIEKGANEGQTQYCKDLFASLRAAISSRPRSSTLTNAAGARGKKRGRKAKSALASNQASDVECVAKVSVKESWGLFEPARPFLGPVVDIIRPILTGNVVYGLLVGLLVASWFGFGTRQGPAMYGRDLGYANYPQRLAAYEEMWNREESELWEWIEERAGLGRLNGGSMPAPKKRTVDPRTVEEKLREERMNERELQEAIRVTEEHLQVLKSVVNRKGKGERTASG